MPIFPKKMPVFGTFRCFFLIFSITELGKDLWFFALCSVSQDTSFELSKLTFQKYKQKKITIRGDHFDQVGVKIRQFGFRSTYRGNKAISDIIREKALQKQFVQHSSAYLVYMAGLCLTVRVPLQHSGPATTFPPLLCHAQQTKAMQTKQELKSIFPKDFRNSLVSLVG